MALRSLLEENINISDSESYTIRKIFNMVSALANSGNKEISEATKEVFNSYLIDTNFSQDEKNKLLEFASRMDTSELFWMLAGVGADINLPFISNAGAYDTAMLHKIIYSADIEEFNRWIAYGANLSILDKKGNSPLHILAKGSFYSGGMDFDLKMDALIAAEVDLNLVNSTGETALHIAARNANIEGIKKLINAGADLNLVNNKGETALEIAAKRVRRTHSYQVLEQLLDSTVEFNMRTRADLNTFTKSVVSSLTDLDDEGNSALHIIAAAAPSGYETIITKLIKYGLDINTLNSAGKTALITASEYDRKEVVSFLIANHANLDIQDKEGRTALIAASEYDRKEVVSLLIANHANLDIQDKEGRTALIAASEYDRKEVVSLLIANHANLDIQDKKGRTALIAAFEYGRNKVVSLLIANHANLDIQDKKGKTILIAASECGKDKVVSLLIANHANIDIQDKEGKTALHYAAYQSSANLYEGSNVQDDSPTLKELSKKIMWELIKSGANLSITSNKGNAVIPLATRSNTQASEEYQVSEFSRVLCSFDNIPNIIANICNHKNIYLIAYYSSLVQSIVKNISDTSRIQVFSEAIKNMDNLSSQESLLSFLSPEERESVIEKNVEYFSSTTHLAMKIIHVLEKGSGSIKYVDSSQNSVEAILKNLTKESKIEIVDEALNKMDDYQSKDNLLSFLISEEKKEVIKLQATRIVNNGDNSINIASKMVSIIEQGSGYISDSNFSWELVKEIVRLIPDESRISVLSKAIDGVGNFQRREKLLSYLSPDERRGVIVSKAQEITNSSNSTEIAKQISNIIKKASGYISDDALSWGIVEEVVRNTPNESRILVVQKVLKNVENTARQEKLISFLSPNERELLEVGIKPTLIRKLYSAFKNEGSPSVDSSEKKLIGSKRARPPER